MEAIVRAATSADEAPLFTLVSSFPTPIPSSAGTFRALFGQRLADASSVVLVAEANGTLIGYVSGSTHVAFYAGGRVAWVDEIFVAPEQRGRGVGALLMAAFETWAGAQPCVQVALATRGAAPFYERLGYASRAGYFKKYLDGRHG